jgi:hypothetical protein
LQPLLERSGDVPHERTVPGIVAHASALDGGRQLDVPDLADG